MKRSADIRRRPWVKSVCALLLITFINQEVAWAGQTATVSTESLSPPLMTGEGGEISSLRAAAICRLIEEDGDLRRGAYLDKVLSKLEPEHNPNITVLPHEITIEVPEENLVVRYFDPGKVGVTTQFGDTARLRTSFINDRLCRQIIHKTGALTPFVASALSAQEADGMMSEAVVSFLETGDYHMLQSAFSRLAILADIDRSTAVEALRRICRDYPILTDDAVHMALSSIPPRARDTINSVLRSATENSQDMKKVKVVILAAGAGTRAWPPSTAKRPKQVLRQILPSGRSTIQEAVYRLIHRGFLEPSQIYVITSKNIKDDVAAQVAEMGVNVDNILVEPIPAGTALAVGYAAKYFERQDPESIMVTMMADIHVDLIDEFQSNLGKAIDMAGSGPYIISLGIKPTSANTQYGYMQVGAETVKRGVCRVLKYVEKPSQDKADEFFRSKNRYRWEGGMLAWRTTTILRAFEEISPEYHGVISDIGRYFDGAISVDDLMFGYDKISDRPSRNLPTSVDHVLFEPIGEGRCPDINIAVVPTNVAWTDIGNLLGIAARVTNPGRIDSNGNLIISGNASMISLSEVTGCNIFHSKERSLKVEGIDHSVVADDTFSNATLVTSLKSATYSKGIAEELMRSGLKEYSEGGAAKEMSDAEVYNSSGCMVYSSEGLAAVNGLDGCVVARSGADVRVWGRGRFDEGVKELRGKLESDFRDEQNRIKITMDAAGNFTYAISKKGDCRLHFIYNDGKVSMHFKRHISSGVVSVFKVTGTEVTAPTVVEILGAARHMGLKKRGVRIPASSQMATVVLDAIKRIRINRLWESRYNVQSREDILRETGIIERFESEQFKIISGWVENGETILDIGSGSGRFAIGLAEKFRDSKVTGVDLLEHAVRMAAAGATMRKVSNVKFIRADALDLPHYLEDNTFDVIYSVGLWQNLRPGECEILTRNIKRLLRPGGKVIISAPNGSAPFYRLWRSIVGDNLRYRFGLERYVTMEEIKDDLTANGFKVHDSRRSDPLYCLRKMYRVDVKTGRAVQFFWSPILRALARFLDYRLIDPLDRKYGNAISNAIGNDNIVFAGLPAADENKTAAPTAREKLLNGNQKQPLNAAPADRSYAGRFSNKVRAAATDPLLKMAIEWLYKSGIQDMSGNPLYRGGVNGWYDAGNKGMPYPFVYSEITGYAVSHFVYIYLQTGRREFLDRAHLAAEWIIRNAIHKRGGLSARLFRGEREREENFYSFNKEVLFTFDTGVALKGMTTLYKITGNRRYFRAARDFGEFILGMQKDDGSFYYAMDGRTGEMKQDEDKWSRQSGTYHAQSMMGLVDLYRLTGDKKYRDCLIRFCDWALSMQEPDGRFVSAPGTDFTYMHPHCYSAAGLIYIGEALDMERYVSAGRRAVKWLFENQAPAGGLPWVYSESNAQFMGPEHADVLAQMLDLGLKLYEGGTLDIDEHKLIQQMALLRTRLEEFQVKEGLQEGGFMYDKEAAARSEENINSWATMFSVETLYRYSEIFEMPGTFLPSVGSDERRTEIAEDARQSADIQEALAAKPGTKLCFVLGTRPEIIKLWPVIRYCHKNNIPYFIIHTNQHYSAEMSNVFLEQFGIQQPKYNLGRPEEITERGAMVSWMKERMVPIMEDEKPSIVLVQGDTNSTYAGALAASATKTPIGHIEAGLRSYDATMPEELNRIEIDRLSSYFFCPTEDDAKSMRQSSSFSDGTEKRIFVTGNTVIDSMMLAHETSGKKSAATSEALRKIGLKKNKYFLFTLHRPANVDDPVILKRIINSVASVSNEVKKRYGEDIPVLFLIHPRTKARLKQFGISLPESFITPPLSDYFMMMDLQANARLIFTDSGGIQEEACALRVPCVVLRENTERPETLREGAAVLAGNNPASIKKAAYSMLIAKRTWHNPFGSGNSAELIIKSILGLPLTRPQTAEVSAEGRSTDTSPYSRRLFEFIDEAAKPGRGIFTKDKEPILLRVPVEVLESMDIGIAGEFLNAFRGREDSGRFVELFYMTGADQAGEAVYQRYGLRMEAFPKNRMRENTVTLLPALKGEEVTGNTIMSRIGTLSMIPSDTIISPVGLRLDQAGLARSTILGMRLLEIARVVKAAREGGVSIKDNKAIKSIINSEIIEPYRRMCGDDAADQFNLTAEDVIGLVSGSINDIVVCARKIIRLLPVVPIEIEEQKHIYEYMIKATAIMS